MPILVRSLFALLLLATLVNAQTNTADRAVAMLNPGDNLQVEGVPPISRSLVERVNRYTEFRTATLADWHPVRREMLIRTRFGDTNQIHEVRQPGGARRQLTFYPENVGGGSFQPVDGRYFVFSKDIGGNEFFQLYRFDTATGETTLLTDGRSRNGGGTWSNKGDRMIYTSTRRNGKDTDLYIVNPADPRTDKLLVQVEGGGWSALDWSPDDRQAIIGEYRSINDSTLYLLDLETGQRRSLTGAERAAGNAETVSYAGAQFAPDGQGFYTATDRGGEFQQLTYIDLKTLQPIVLSGDIPWDVEQFELSKDGSTIAFVTNEDGIGVLHLMDARSRKMLPVPKLPVGLIGGIEWHDNNRDLGFVLTSARSTADVYSLDVKTGKVERWTESETGGLNTPSLVEPMLVKWQSFDNKTISGFLYRPPVAKFPGKRPVVINIHGGPEGQARPGFLGRGNYYLNELGVAIIYPNVRGSSGYGKTFLKLDNGFKREDTYKDIGALLDWIKTQPDLDSNRVMVTGGSYGGHMTFACATLYSDRLRAALPVVGISNLVSLLERTESYRRDLRRVEYGDERDPKMREFMTRIAPLTNASKITIPMFVVAGKNDPRVPLNEAEQMVAAVRKNGTPVWFLAAADEGHGFQKKRNQDFQFYATVMFMQQYLIGDNTNTPTTTTTSSAR